MKKKILVVDDEQDLCEILEFNLQIAGYEVTTAHSAEQALQLQPQTFDLILLDVMMDGMSGFDMAEQLKGQTPIIFITARDSEDDMLHGFNIGADDYIAKPFSVKEVLARVKAVLHRTLPDDNESSNHGLVLNDDSKMLTVDGQQVPMTKTELHLLRLLMNEPKRVFSRQEIIDLVWPSDVIVTDRTIDVNITRLRKKLGDYAQCIATRPGFGYYFDEQAN